jgi:hypothetical protein
MRKSATFFTGLAIALAAAGCNSYDQETFAATLNGANEVPPSGVAATGSFSATVDGPVTHYTLTIAAPGLTEITQAHIHDGAAGANGNVRVWLFDGPTTSAAAPFTGALPVAGSFVEATIAACTGTCLAGRNYDNTVEAMQAGTAYVNVHTVANPGGAIRGQIN